MGSFSVSCALTGVTLANCAAVLIPLAPSRYPSGGSRLHPSPMGGAYVCSNEGASAIFGALTLPIIGEVGDYGELESFEEDDNVRFLQKRFGSQLDQFLEGVTRGGHTKLTDKIARKVGKDRFDKKYPVWDGNLSGCWVAREAWDLFSTQAWNESGTSRATVGDDGWLDPQTLKAMGFQRGAKDQTTAIALFGAGPHQGDRYNTPYTHPELPEFVLWCDECMSSKASYKGKQTEIGLKFQSFLKALKKLGLKLPESSMKAVTSTSIFRGYLLKAQEEYARNMKSRAEHEKFLEEHPQAWFTRIEDGASEDTHVYCSRDPYRFGKGGRAKHFHVTLMGGQSASAEVQSFTVVPCPGCSENNHKSIWGRGLQFTPEVWEALREAGWKPRRSERLPPPSLSSIPYLRGFPEEALHLYKFNRNSILSDKFLPLLEKLLCFESNMYAANRILAPTASGWQCGNDATQIQVAKMALKLAQARVKRYKY